MKKIQYRFVSGQKNTGTPVSPVWEDILTEKALWCREDDQLPQLLALGEAEAFDGRCTVTEAVLSEDPTEDDRVRQLEEALELLLSGVTE